MLQPGGAGLDNAARRAILASLDRFIRDRLAPAAAAIEESAQFPQELYRAIGELGIFGLYASPEHGGTGPDLVTPLLVAERLARVSVAFSLSVSNMGDCMVPIAAAGTDWARQTYLPPLARGELVPCICLTEPSGGSDVAAIRTRAARDGKDYVIDGRKAWITSAPVADIAVLFAKTDPDAGHKGITAFVVPMDAKGVSVGKPETLMGLRGSPTAEITFDGVRVPAAARLGEENEGFRIAMTTLDESRLNVAAISLGAATAAVETAVEYARERVQFGKPIIEHQGLQFLLADLTAGLAGARALWEKAVEVLERGPSRLASHYAGMAKLVASDLAMKAAIDAAQVLGANGLSKNHLPERLIRDCKALQIFEGSNEIQRWQIGRQLQKSGLVLEELDGMIAGEG